MSADGRYILKYDVQDYKEPTPMQKDIKYLTEKYGGKIHQMYDDINYLAEYELFYEKPKYKLIPEDIQELKADQILESVQGENWEDITYKYNR